MARAEPLRKVVIEIEVNVAYRGGPFPNVDRSVAKLAHGLGGVALGSGYALRKGVRDLCYGFKEMTNAATFAREVLVLLP